MSFKTNTFVFCYLFLHVKMIISKASSDHDTQIKGKDNLANLMLSLFRFAIREVNNIVIQ